MMSKTQQPNATNSSRKHTSTPGCFSGLKKFLASLARVFKRKCRKEVLVKGEQQSVEAVPCEGYKQEGSGLALAKESQYQDYTSEDDLNVPAPSQDTIADHCSIPASLQASPADQCSTPAPPLDSCVEVITPSTEDTNEWHLVCNKKTQGMKKKPFLETQKSKAVEASTSLAGTKCAKTNRRRNTLLSHQDSRDKVRQSWAQETVTVVLQVAPNMRGHVVGHGGEALRTLAREYPSVRVTVPPPRDTQTTTITIRGVPVQVTAVQGCISARLKTAQRRRHLPRGDPARY